MEIQGTGAFVTGGARGIGRAITEALLAKGAKVVFCDVNQSLGEATEKELQEQYGGKKVFFTPCDVSDASQLSAAFQKAVSLFGNVDIDVNNAGIIREDDMEKTIAVNQLGYMRGTVIAEEHMRKDKGGRGGVIVNIASIGGLYVSADCPTYIATKHAVVGFTSSMALRQREADTGVRLICVCPGGVMTGIAEKAVFLSTAKIRVPTEMLCSPSVIGEAVVKVVEDQDNNGGLLEVHSIDCCKYRRRQVVDMDGVSNPSWGDESIDARIAAHCAQIKASSATE